MVTPQMSNRIQGQYYSHEVPHTSYFNQREQAIQDQIYLHGTDKDESPWIKDFIRTIGQVSGQYVHPARVGVTSKEDADAWLAQNGFPPITVRKGD